MNLGILNETVILIDTDFLNERISHHLTFYKDLFPDKEFEKIKLANLLYNFILNARIEEAGHNVDILFAYTLGNDILTNFEPNNVFSFIDTNQVQMETEKGTFLIRSFFADEDETCTEHFINMLRMINNSPRVSRIIMVADNPDLNFELEMMNEQNDKSLFIFKKHHLQTAIDADVKYVTILYPIAYALGLDNSEI
jgi:hypothetical protein